jgi:Uma2 family endonuclease
MAFRREMRSMTLEEYYAIPEDGPRLEIINGVVYDMAAAPSPKHQIAVGVLYQRIREFLRQKRLGRVFLSPLDTEIDKRSVVQPDVQFFRAGRVGRWAGRRSFPEPPDFVAEVLSPTTATKDLTLKRDKYEKAGVREYWILDPETEEVVVFCLRDGSYQSVEPAGPVVTSEVIEGFSMDVREFWAEVDEDLTDPA